MSHRTTPTAAEVLPLMRHLADVAALRSDPPAQRQRLVDGLGDLFDATLGWFFVMDDGRPGRTLRPVHAVLASNLDPVWVRYTADFAVHIPPSADPYADHMIRSPDAVQQWTRPRVLPDAAARRRYAVTLDVIDRAGIGGGAVCGFRAGPAGDRLVGFSLHRCRSDPPLRPRDYALHRLAIDEIRRLADRGHLPLDAAPADRLSPRLQQVLALLLAGHAPKLIARRLGLSVWTVRDHVQRLYRLSGVTSRDQLMARHIARPST